MSSPDLSTHIPDAVATVARRLGRKGFRTYVVGGCVRDLLLGRDIHDWDLTTSATPDQVTAAFRKVIPTGIKHGTVTVLIDQMALEVTTMRGEGAYSDGRHPDSVEFVTEITEDLSRRDLTINAMALDPDGGNIVDPFEGQKDLAARRIRAVGDPHDRFNEDGLRPLRAIRFSAVLGFDVEPATARAVADTIATFRKVSAERVRDEMWKLLGAPEPRHALDLLHSTGLQAEILPELGPQQWRHAAAVASRCPPGPVTRFAALLHRADPAHVEERLDALRASTKEKNRIKGLVCHLSTPLEASASDGALRRFVATVGWDMIDDLLVLRAAIAGALGAGSEEPQPQAAPRQLSARQVEQLAQRIQEIKGQSPPLSRAELAVSGKTLMETLDLTPGPVLGRLLDHLLDRVLDDPTKNKTPALIAEARQHLALLDRDAPPAK